MAFLEQSQHSHRRLGLRALLDQLRANPGAVGKLVDPEVAWRTLADAEQRDPGALADILLYPAVGVWLTRALHYTRPASTGPWRELGYLNNVAAAAAVRCGVPCVIRVPVWHGAVSLPTVGHVRLPGTFPIGSVEVHSAGRESRIQVGTAMSIPLDGTNTAFAAACEHTCTSHGHTLRARLDDQDPYHGFGEPRPPADLADSDAAEWRKVLDEAWDVLALNHPAYAQELAAGLRGLVPIEPDTDTVGASSPAAFGGIRLSANGSATEFAEAMVHEMQHSKLNALLGLVQLTQDDNVRRHLAPWRDDPRPLIGVVHGIYAFTCGVEFWVRHGVLADGTETRRIDFDIAYRRLQVRRAVHTLTSSDRLTPAGMALVDAVSKRLTRCEQAPVDPALSHIVTTLVDDHRALWRLRHARPDTETVAALTAAWLDGAAPPSDLPWQSHIVAEDERRLPANRRNLLRAKAIEPETFAALARRPASLSGTTPRADAALCTGDAENAAQDYRERLRIDPDDTQAWAGLGLALRAQGRAARALLEHPEVTVAVHRRVRALDDRAPDPAALSTWLSAAL
ncbi:HEXXH motif domain-containing protein [Actinophytocola algeriensis]|uniref:HEXXH motif-containing protein n=1 Tax=Actinophytocola algeriensis TaxID=1768010 RepID=A0A7W7VEX7_9PSEU|nr:HEXXH motif domain-containing protein [Actinophytocola algeriensis]MBB4907589.1 HEXXH motif-containing protein [Actinophytocola algeriensis]MBE1479619.1 HEXXH motif-containing protein [Actinophytocola algeriensis]